MSDRYPKAMVHPGYHPAKIVRPGKWGEPVTAAPAPDSFPPVTVNNEQQEEMHRAMGYREQGEAPPPMIDYSEYPLMLVHPEHVDGVPAQSFARKDEATGAITTWTEPGIPEKYPHRQVNNAAEEAEWTAKGWQRPGRADPDAMQASRASPHVPDRTVQEWPKMVDGKVVDPYTANDGPQLYPMWAHGEVVDDETAHRARFPEDFIDKPLPEPEPDPRDAELATLRARIAELEEIATAPTTEPMRGKNRSAKVA